MGVDQANMEGEMVGMEDYFLTKPIHRPRSSSLGSVP